MRTRTVILCDYCNEAIQDNIYPDKPRYVHFTGTISIGNTSLKVEHKDMVFCGVDECFADWIAHEVRDLIKQEKPKITTT